MKTPEEIKKGLECCKKASEEACDHCPYCKECINFNAGNLYRDALAYINQLEARVPKWISVKERMPESGEKVIALLQSKTFQRYRLITMLAHIGAHEKTTDDSDWRDCECDTEYDEKNDCYWIAECWYEVNVVDDNPNWIIDSDYNVTHWMPLPTFPTEKEEAK